MVKTSILPSNQHFKMQFLPHREHSTRETHQLTVFRGIMTGQMQCFIRLVWRWGYHIVISMVLVTAQGQDSFLQHDTSSPPLFTSSLYHSGTGNKAYEYTVAERTSQPVNKTYEPVKLALRLTCHTI